MGDVGPHGMQVGQCIYSLIQPDGKYPSLDKWTKLDCVGTKTVFNSIEITLPGDFKWDSKELAGKNLELKITSQGGVGCTEGQEQSWKAIFEIKYAKKDNDQWGDPSSTTVVHPPPNGEAQRKEVPFKVICKQQQEDKTPPTLKVNISGGSIADAITPSSSNALKFASLDLFSLSIGISAEDSEGLSSVEATFKDPNGNALPLVACDSGSETKCERYLMFTPQPLTQKGVTIVNGAIYNIEVKAINKHGKGDNMVKTIAFPITVETTK